MALLLPLLVTAAPPGPPPPAWPHGPPACVSRGTDSATLSWDAVPGATLYEVAVGDPSGIATVPFGSFTTPTAGRGVQIDDLLDGHEYAFKVRAHVGYGGDQMILGWTNFSSATSCATASPHPLAPRRLRRATSALMRDSIDLAWDAPALLSNDGAARGSAGASTVSGSGVYAALYREAGTNAPWTEAITTVGYDAAERVIRVEGLAPGRTFEAVVEARHGGGVGAVRGAPSVFRTANASTVWINPHRVTENDLSTVDFLSNHNSGTIEGDVGFMTMGGNSSHFFELYSSPLTSYCVEMLKVDLSSLQRTPSNPPSIPADPQYADYVSCNGDRGGTSPTGWGNYTCICDNVIDRVIAHQTKEQITSVCGDVPRFPGVCSCGEASLAASAKYTGLMATSLPWFDVHDMGPGQPWPPVPPSKITSFGGWYSTPSAGKCEDSTGRVGDKGCTWRRHPRATLVYGHDLVSSGWVIVPQGGNVTDTVIRGNVVAANKAFGALPFKPRCCGC